MLCLLFRGDGERSFMLFGPDSVSRRFDTAGDRGDEMEGDRSSVWLMSPKDDERVIFGDGCSVSVGLSV
ncbi:hypothetical protein HanRHA438_Chr08g0342361 [Helianthus annuus]|nr:hypothetical protein HanRHA438_Chr08g0342361 [Helianthus annuus]